MSTEDRSAVCRAYSELLKEMGTYAEDTRYSAPCDILSLPDKEATFEPRARLAFDIDTPELQRLCVHMHAHIVRARRAKKWLIDTGANIVVVPTGDPMILPETVRPGGSLNTAAGGVTCEYAHIRTPFGLCEGMVCSGSPRLLPWGLFHFCALELRWPHDADAFVILPDNTKRIFPIVDGIPTCPDGEQIADARETLARRDPNSPLGPAVPPPYVRDTDHRASNATTELTALLRIIEEQAAQAAAELASTPDNSLAAAPIQKHKRKRSKPRVPDTPDDDDEPQPPPSDVPAAQPTDPPDDGMLPPDLDDTDSVIRELWPEANLSNDTGPLHDFFHTFHAAHKRGGAGLCACCNTVVGRAGVAVPALGSGFTAAPEPEWHATNQDRPEEPDPLASPRVPPTDGDPVPSADSSVHTRRLETAFSGAHVHRAPFRRAKRDVICVYIIRRGDPRRVLLAERTSGGAGGVHAPPGGRVMLAEPDELSLVASRFVYELTALPVSGLTMVAKTYSNSKPSTRLTFHHFVAIASKDAVPLERREHKYGVWGWHDVDNLPNNVVDSTRDFLRMHSMHLKKFCTWATRHVAAPARKPTHLRRIRKFAVRPKRKLIPKSRLHAPERPGKPHMLPQYTEHQLTHFPYDKDCKICQRARLTASDGRRRPQSEKLLTKVDEDHVRIVCDFKGPYAMGYGQKSWLLVFRMRHGSQAASPFFCATTKTRSGDEALYALHDARMEWGVETLPFTLKSDREGAFIGPEWRRYMAFHRGRPKRSIRGVMITKRECESAVRYAAEGLRATLLQACARTNWWPHAAQTWCLHYNRSVGYDPRTNTAGGSDVNLRKHIAFGALGYAVLPFETYGEPHLAGEKGVPVVFLAYDILASRAVYVAFYDRKQGTLRQTHVHVDHVQWEADKMAYTFREVNLQREYNIHDSFQIAEPEIEPLPDEEDRPLVRHYAIQDPPDPGGVIDEAPDTPRADDDPPPPPNPILQPPLPHEDIADDSHRLFMCARCNKWRSCSLEVFHQLFGAEPELAPDVTCSDIAGGTCDEPEDKLAIEAREEEQDDVDARAEPPRGDPLRRVEFGPARPRGRPRKDGLLPKQKALPKAKLKAKARACLRPIEANAGEHRALRAMAGRHDRHFEFHAATGQIHVSSGGFDKYECCTEHPEKEYGMCQSWYKLGYCSRGLSCPFPHELEPILFDLPLGKMYSDATQWRPDAGEWQHRSLTASDPVHEYKMGRNAFKTLNNLNVPKSPQCNMCVACYHLNSTLTPGALVVAPHDEPPDSDFRQQCSAHRADIAAGGMGPVRVQHDPNYVHLPERLKPRVIRMSESKTREEILAELADEILYRPSDDTLPTPDDGFPIVVDPAAVVTASVARRANGFSDPPRDPPPPPDAAPAAHQPLPHRRDTPLLPFAIPVSSDEPEEAKAQVEECRRLELASLAQVGIFPDDRVPETTAPAVDTGAFVSMPSLLRGKRRCILTGDVKPSGPKTSSKPSQQANVTRAATRTEKESPAGRQCRREEMQKLVDFNCLGDIYSMGDASSQFKNATVSGVHVLTSVKHAERLIAAQKFKGRAVLLGDKITRMCDGVQTFPNSVEAGIYGPVTTLQAARAIVARSLVHQYPLESVDLTSAYLQAEWPDNLPPHFLKLTPDAFDMLPDDVRAKARKVSNPVFKMERCLYGHPLSGHIWIETFLSFMRAQGFVSLADDPALMQRGNIWLCIYVDDVAACGPPKELAAMWAELRGRFKVGMEEKLTDFLGLRIVHRSDATGREAFVDMSDYARLCVDTYAELWPESVVRPKDTPMSDELRLIPGHEPPPTQPERRVQKILGMLLWLARCGRPDIALAVSRLGSRAARWNEACSKELLRLVGYLQVHHDKAIRMRIENADNIADLRAVVSCDANLPPAGKAQTGYVLALEGEHGSLLPVSWASKGQPLTADSTLMSELIAAHTAVRETLTLGSALQNDVIDQASVISSSVICKPIILRVDNEGVLSNCRRGVSDACGVMSKALHLRVGLLRDLREMGLFDVVYVRTDKNRSDMYTKALAHIKLVVALQENGIFPVDQPKRAHGAMRTRRNIRNALRHRRDNALARLARALSATVQA
ncbi:MAG: reverse transcriptase domain-containing protein [Vicinamibacterales bacterium]|nr:reverse transcriptase domain-containing protein [Vicinamibacterales bacterium]